MVQSYTNQPSTILSSITHQLHGAKLHQSTKHNFVINHTSIPWCKATPINQAQFCHQSHINSMVQSYTNQPSTILSSITHQLHGAKLHQSTNAYVGAKLSFIPPLNSSVLFFSPYILKSLPLCNQTRGSGVVFS